MKNKTLEEIIKAIKEDLNQGHTIVIELSHENLANENVEEEKYVL